MPSPITYILIKAKHKFYERLRDQNIEASRNYAESGWNGDFIADEISESIREVARDVADSANLETLQEQEPDLLKRGTVHVLWEFESADEVEGADDTQIVRANLEGAIRAHLHDVWDNRISGICVMSMAIGDSDASITHLTPLTWTC